MNRRKVLLAFITIAAVSILPNPQSFHRHLEFDSRQTTRKRKNIRNLKIGGIYLAEADGLFYLPSNPSDGDFVHIVVDNKSVLDPCTLNGNGVKVLGYKESLSLDSLANIKLTYRAATKNWHFV